MHWKANWWSSMAALAYLAEAEWTELNITQLANISASAVSKSVHTASDAAQVYWPKVLWILELGALIYLSKYQKKILLTS